MVDEPLKSKIIESQAPTSSLHEEFLKIKNVHSVLDASLIRSELLVKEANGEPLALTVDGKSQLLSNPKLLATVNLANMVQHAQSLHQFVFWHKLTMEDSDKNQFFNTMVLSYSISKKTSPLAKVEDLGSYKAFSEVFYV